MKFVDLHIHSTCSDGKVAPKDLAFTEKMADKYGLFMSIGSDYHGVVKPTVKLFDGHGGLQDKLGRGAGVLKEKLFDGRNNR